MFSDLLPPAHFDRYRTRYGDMFALSGDSVIGRSLRLYGEWAENEISYLASFLSDGDAIVDVGANIGTHALAFARRFPQSTIVAIEPQPWPCAALLANVELNGCDRVRVLNLGCASLTAVTDVRFDYEVLGGNAGAFDIRRFRVDSPAGYPLTLTSIDNLEILEKVQLLKVDVEGMEADVLRGAAGLLTRDRPIVFFELLNVEALSEPRALLLDRGYDLYWLETQPFNADNFNRCDENVWASTELGVLAVPSGRRPLDLLPVTGLEEALPKQGSNPLLRMP